MSDAAATIVGAALGTSTTTTYIESAAGVEEGGRTGLTSVVVGILMLSDYSYLDCSKQSLLSLLLRSSCNRCYDDVALLKSTGMTKR